MAINREDLGKRLAVGAVYVAIVSVSTIVSWYTTVIVVAIMASLCCYEFLRMARTNGFRPYIIIGTLSSALIPLAFCLASGSEHVVVGGLVVAFCAAILMLLRFFIHEEDTIVDVAITLFALFYTGMLLSSFILLRGYYPGVEGGVCGFIVLASVWMNDGFAYLGGSAFGRHKMAPKISPKKSWEGVFFGLAGSVIAWLFMPLVLPDCQFGYGWAAISGLLVGIVSVIGDLTESHIKRGFKAKDSGDIMPGHGGMLDRSDSLLFASVVSYGMVAGAPYIFNFLGFAL